MFEKFGELESWRELNEVAKSLWKEGDKESLKILCEENGLDDADIEDAAADGAELYVTPVMAAMGRLSVEKKHSVIPEEARNVIFGMASAMAADPGTAPLFVQKGKRLDAVWKTLEEMARKNKSGSMGFACGTDRDLSRIIRENYGGAA